MKPNENYRGTMLQAHDVERITLEDGRVDQTRWVRVSFHRKDGEMIEVVAFPADRSRPLRVEQPAGFPDFAEVDAGKARAAAFDEVLRIPQVKVGGTEGYISIKAVRRLAAKPDEVNAK